MSGGEVVIRRVEGLVSDLRATSVPIGVGELTDAMAAITHVDLSRRNELRLALASTLVKRDTDYPVFDILFDVWFPAGVARGQLSGVPLRDRLVQALTNDDDTQLVQLAREAAAEGPARTNEQSGNSERARWHLMHYGTAEPQVWPAHRQDLQLRLTDSCVRCAKRSWRDNTPRLPMTTRRHQSVRRTSKSQLPPHSS